MKMKWKTALLAQLEPNMTTRKWDKTPTKIIITTNRYFALTMPR
jgi:hypothetical protein